MPQKVRHFPTRMLSRPPGVHYVLRRWKAFQSLARRFRIKKNLKNKKSVFYQVYIHIFFVAGGNAVKKLQHLCKKVIVNEIQFPHHIKELQLPASIERDLIKEYANLIDFPAIEIPLFSKEADDYFNFEKNIKYSRPFPRRFFSIIKGSSWVRKYFGSEPLVCKHLIEKNIISLRKSGNEKYPAMCAQCYVNSEYYPTVSHYVETKHTIFRGTPDQLFEKIFATHMWCSRCKKTPIFDILETDDCFKKYGHFAHYCCDPGFGCFSCFGGTKLFKYWFEEVSDVIEFMY